MAGASPCENHRFETQGLNYYNLFHLLYVFSSNDYLAILA